MKLPPEETATPIPLPREAPEALVPMRLFVRMLPLPA